jgi:acetyl-CoA synthetase
VDIISRFLPRTDFASFEDFRDHYRVEVPAGFNFAFDVVDERAARTPPRWSGATRPGARRPSRSRR